MTSSPTRGVVAGGGGINTIDYVQFATIGNAIDFGDLTAGNLNILLVHQTVMEVYNV